MSLTSIIFVLLVLAVLGFAVLKAKLENQSGSVGEGKYKAKALLTENELEFLGRLESAAPELRFHSQVSMGALIEPDVSRKNNGKDYYRLRGMISQKIVDYVAQNRNDGSIVAIIELDDRTHNNEKDAKRDAMLASAGYRIIRWNSKAKPDLAAIRAKLLTEGV